MSPNKNDISNNNENEVDSLENLKGNLYSRRDHYSLEKKSQSTLHQHDIDVPTGWGGETQIPTGRYLPNHPVRMRFLKKFFIASIVFFVISACVSAYVFFSSVNTISSNNVDILIVGPVSIAGGEILPLEIKVTNQNNTDLETADLIIEYPEGTREATDVTSSLKRHRDALGVINKGGSALKKINAVLFGESGDTKEISVSVEYRVKGSNAIFLKTKKYTVEISSAPVSMTVTAVKEINSNQSVEITIDVVSNASDVIRKLSVSAQYPFGFTFKDASPAPSWSNSFWHLGDIKPGTKRTIKIRGTISGQDNEDRSFRFSAGTESQTNENAIGINFLTSNHKITIKKPFISTSLVFNGDSSDVHIATVGKAIRADLALGNNIGVKLTDIKVSVKLSGSIFDSASVIANGGFYRASDGVISWDQTLQSDLSVLNPDDTALLSFSLNLLEPERLRLIKNPTMTITVNVSGKRLNEAGLSQEINSSISKNIRVPSMLGFSARLLYFSGPFTNTGPLPPKVDAETTYTIVWSLTNGSNDLNNVFVSARIPSYVKWLGAFVPNGERIIYNPVGGKIIWDVGQLKAGTGYSNSPREVSFQVSIIPGSSQINNTPILMSEAVATGDDAFANLTIESNLFTTMTTELKTDINYKPGQGIVVK